MDKYNLYDCAVVKWGKDFQILMAIEEMAELTQELIHYVRKNKSTTYTEMSSEIADVQIMMEQLIHMFSISDMVKAQKREKLRKLEKYVKEG